MWRLKFGLTGALNDLRGFGTISSQRIIIPATLVLPVLEIPVLFDFERATIADQQQNLIGPHIHDLLGGQALSCLP